MKALQLAAMSTPFVLMLVPEYHSLEEGLVLARQGIDKVSLGCLAGPQCQEAPGTAGLWWKDRGPAVRRLH